MRNVLHVIFSKNAFGAANGTMLMLNCTERVIYVVRWTCYRVDVLIFIAWKV